MTPYQQQLFTTIAIVLVGLTIVVGLIVLAKSKWAVKKKVIGGGVFLLGFLFLAMVWAIVEPYFFSGDSVIGKVSNVDCSGDIQQYSVRGHYPDCKYQIAYNLDNKDQTTTVNSMSSALILSQGQEVAVYYKKDSSGKYTLGFGNIGDNKNLLTYLSTHLFVFTFLGMGTLFFFVGLKLMGLISKHQADRLEESADNVIKGRL